MARGFLRSSYRVAPHLSVGVSQSVPLGRRKAPAEQKQPAGSTPHEALAEAIRQHHALTEQALLVIDNQREIEVMLARRLGDIDRIRGAVREAEALADLATARGDGARATHYRQTGQEWVTQIETAEQNVAELRTLHEQSSQAAQQAKQALERNAAQLERNVAG